jgi:hypothetical protein
MGALLTPALSVVNGRTIIDVSEEILYSCISYGLAGADRQAGVFGCTAADGRAAGTGPVRN